MGVTISKTDLVDGVRTYTFEAEAGSHISNAISDALGILFYKTERFPNEPLHGLLVFNDLQVPMAVGDSEKVVMTRYQKMSDERRAEYLKSPEHAEQQRRQAASQQLAQQTVNTQVPVIVELCKEWSATPRAELQPHGQLAMRLMVALVEYCEATDHVGVDSRAAEVIEWLQKAGYVQNEYVGRGEEITLNYHSRAWIVGQILDMLIGHGSVHQAIPAHITNKKLHIYN